MSSDNDNGSGKIVKFTRLETPPGVPNPAVVDLLERMLEEAKAGTIQGIALATVLDDGGTGSAYVVNNAWARLLGATQYVVHRLCVNGDNVE